MKNAGKTMLALFMTLAMCFCFAACGGGGNGEGDGGTPEGLSENLGGVGEVVFNLPEGYETEYDETSYYSAVKEGSKIVVGISMVKQDELPGIAKSGGPDAKTLDEYLKILKDPEFGIDDPKKEKTEITDTEICGVDGFVSDSSYDGKTYDLACTFKFNDAVYSVFLYTSDAWDDDGNFNKDVKELSGEDKATFEAIKASVKEGKHEPGPVTLGDLEFTTPEGFEISSWDNGCSFSNENLKFDVYSYTLDELSKNYEENFDSIDDFMNKMKEWAGDDSETYKVCDNDCLIEKYENGGYGANLAIGDKVYEFYAQAADAFDDDGNENPDCHKITDDDYAAFKAFLDGVKLVK